MKRPVGLFFLLALAALAIFTTEFSIALAGDPTSVGVTTGPCTPRHQPLAETKPVPLIGAKAGVDYHGDAMVIKAEPNGVRLHCVFQQLDGEASPEGLSVTSTATNPAGDRFQVKAVRVGSSTSATPLETTGVVVLDGQTVRFERSGLVEEYSVSVDGVRQDFVVTERPGGDELRLELAVSGAQVDQAIGGATLVLEKSGRKIAYGRLQATDATGKELPARMMADHGTLVVRVNDAGASYPVRIDPTFSDANWISLGGLHGVDAYVLAAAVDGSGNLYIGGSFSFAGGVAANRVAKWDGNKWSALGSGMNGTVRALAVSGSTLYAGGDFTTADGVTVNCIAKWNGSSWSALSSGMYGGTWGAVVFALAVDGAGNLYAGGTFEAAGGGPASNIAKWDGNNWSALSSGMGIGVINIPYVYALAASGCTLYAGGAFKTAGGVTVNEVAKWDGSRWSALGSGILGPYGYAVSALAVDGSGNLYAGGSFTNAGGVTAGNIAKWNGSSWSTLGSGMNGGVSGLAVSGTNLYAAGTFTGAGAVSANCAAKWNGTSWSKLATGLDNYAYALAVSGTNLYAAGNFMSTAYGESQLGHVGKWDGSHWSALGAGMDGTVLAFAVSGSNVYAGGQFMTTSGGPAKHIAKWDGSSWSALGSGFDTYGYVRALALDGAGNLYAGGDFTKGNGSPANYVAKWNGSSWSAVGSPTFYGVYALVVTGNVVYAGGASGVTMWNGSAWSALGSQMNGTVRALAKSGSNLYAGGDFTTASGATVNYIAKWNGSSWSALGSGMSGSVYALAVDGSGNLYAGGLFTTAGGVTANRIGRWNGSTWSALGSGMSGPVYALAVSGNNLYAGGLFTTVGGVAANYIAQWDGSNWSALGSGVAGNDGLNSTAVLALMATTGKMYAGGDFTLAGGAISTFAAEAILQTNLQPPAFQSGAGLQLKPHYYSKSFELRQ